MKIYLDNIIFSLQRAGGISVYWSELTKRIDQLYDVTFISHRGDSKNLFYDNYLRQNSTLEIGIPLFIKRFLPLLKRLPVGCIFHSSYHRVSLQADIINITTVHDCGHELGLMQKGFKRKIHLLFKGWVLKNSHGIICVSKNTMSDLLKFYPFIKSDCVRVIYNGAGAAYKKIPAATKSLSLLPAKYVLFVGGRYDYKNFKTVVELLSTSDLYHFVIIGGGALTNQENSLLDSKMPGRYLLLTTVANDQLNVIYNKAFCLIYPSLYEGFGIPVLEAMTAGCPVIAMNTSSIPEVAGDACLLLDKLDSDGFYTALNYLEDPVNRADTISKGLSQAEKFSWDKSARETAEFYRFIYERKNLTFETVVSRRSDCIT